MPFENFYKESDRTAERRRGRIALAFIAAAAYLIFGGVLLSAYFERQSVRDAETERRESVSAFCDGLPKPESFAFVRRDLPVSHETGASISYYYKSPDTHDKIMFAFNRSRGGLINYVV